MNVRRATCVLLLVLAIVSGFGSALAQPTRSALPTSRMQRIPGGTFVPFYGGDKAKPQRVKPFWLDRHPVTNAEYLRFVSQDVHWQKSRVARLYADAEYLASWAGDASLGPNAAADAPVVGVSWFSASAYCEQLGARLPTEAEWELVAQADEKRKDAHRDNAFVNRILEWYAHPAQRPGEVMQSKPNAYGVFDMHGLIWEWIEDFNASIVSADDRARDDPQAGRVCGGAAFGAQNPADYAAFMRYAFRSSLKAPYTVHNLGFRCARNGE
jgi:sulfatase modifying factor 1